MISQTKIVYLVGAALSLSLAGCSIPNARVATRINQGASLAADLPLNPLGAKVITSWIDKRSSTMSTLYGNDLAVQYARANSRQSYPAGAVLSLVTWSQQEDPRWFGAKIPEKVRSVEFVTVGNAPDGRLRYSYGRFEGTPLKKMSDQEGFVPNDRATSLLSQRAAVMP